MMNRRFFLKLVPTGLLVQPIKLVQPIVRLKCCANSEAQWSRFQLSLFDWIHTSE